MICCGSAQVVITQYISLELFYWQPYDYPSANGRTHMQCQTLEKYLQVWHTCYFRDLYFWCLQARYSEQNHHLHKVLSYSVDFKDHREIRWVSQLWNPLSQPAPDKFHGCGGHSKRNCLQDPANFHRSQAWQIVLIFNNAYISQKFMKIW